MDVDVIEDDGRNIGLVRIRGTFCTGTIEKLRKAVSSLMVPGKDVKHYVIDLKRVETVDCMVVGALLSILQRIREMNGDIRFSCMSSTVRELFENTQMQKMLIAYETRAEAVRSYRD